MVNQKLTISSNSIKIFIISVALYGLLLLDSGYYFVAQGSYFIAIQIVLAFIMLLASGAKISKRIVIIALIMISIVVLSSVGNGDSVRNIVVTTSEIIIAALIASAVTENQELVIKTWRKLMIVISVFSLVVFILTIVPNSILMRFPIYGSDTSLPAYFVGLSFAYSPRAYFVARNLGLFWEPGAYQTYLNLALLCEMFLYSDKNRRNILILTITIITTVSTTGIICGLTLWTLYAFKQKSKAYGFLLGGLILAIVVVVIINMDLLPEYFRFSVFTKLAAVFGIESANIITANTRVDSFTYGLKLFLENPVIGIGRNMGALKEVMENNIASCTPINWLAQYGFVLGGMIYYGMFRATHIITSKKSERVIIFLVFILSISTEAFNYSPTLFFIAFIGYSSLSNQCIGERPSI